MKLEHYPALNTLGQLPLLDIEKLSGKIISNKKGVLLSQNAF
jgi:hypothetical protein